MPALSDISNKIPAFLKTKQALGAGALLILVAAGYWFTHQSKSRYQFVTVTRGNITDTVSVTGNTVPVKSVSLGFGNGGTIARVYAAVGNKVAAGSVLASLNVGDLAAQLKQAQANVDAQKARLAGLAAGSRPEDIAAAQAAYDKSLQDLANLYAGVSDTATDSYTKANDAVRTQLSAFFSNGETDRPQLTFMSSNSQAKSDAESGRLAVGAALNAWQKELASLAPSSSESDVEAAIRGGALHLAVIRSFLATVSTALNGAVNLDATTLAAYKADVAAALSETNVAAKNLNAASQSIASERLAVAQLKAQLELKKSGSSAQDIAAQAAQVEAAQASADSIQAKMANSVIVSPISGLVTQFDAKAGQIASPGAPLISIISSSAFEVDAQVPETDIGKISVGDSVSMTFDAFPKENFSGSVFYIDPAQTVASGAVNYAVKVSFAKPDARMKSGLTANLDIATKSVTGVLTLPQYAILENDTGTFVEILENGKTVQLPVVLGIKDNKGLIEVLSGVTEGERVLNIGLKQ